MTPRSPLVALVAALVTLLLALTTSSSHVTAQLARSGTSTPILAHTFDAALSSPLSTSQGSYTWLAGTGLHTGLASFDGTSNYLNLLTVPDSKGAFLPATLPASFSIELWVCFTGWNTNSRIFDVGTADGSTTDSFSLGNIATTGDLSSNVYGGSAGTTQTQLTATGAFDVDAFQHVVLTVDTLAQPSGNARYLLYVDGIVRQNITAVAPRASGISRSVGYLARSLLSPTVAYAAMQLDAFFFYDYAIDYEQVTLHKTLERIYPQYEVTMGTDPRVLLGMSSTAATSYSWLVTDPQDSAALQTVRIGLIRLDASLSQYIDLAAQSGASSLGFSFPRFGRFPGGVVSVANDALSMSWSYEFLLKFRTVASNVRIFDCQTASFSDGFSFGLNANSVFTVTIANSNVGSSLTFSFGTAPVSNTWYHVVIVSLGQARATSNNTAYYAYVNGVQAGTASSTNVELANVDRPLCMLGRSSAAASSYMDGLFSSIRIYNTALAAANVAKVYAITQLPTPALPSNWTPDFEFSTRPLFTWTFDQPPTDAQSIASVLSWDGGSAKHSGLLTFDGLTTYANLNTYTDNYGSNFGTTVFGGNLSIEVWASWSSFVSWSRVVDCSSSSGTAKDGLVIANRLATSTLGVDTYGGSGDYGAFIYANNILSLNTWYHIVMTAQQIDYTVATGKAAALITLYVNGQKMSTGTSYLPRSVMRSNSFFGRANIGGTIFNGLVDDVYFYNYTLSAEAVDAHYVVPRVPIFETVFDVDPRNNLRMPASVARYDWNGLDGSDAPQNRSAHIGLLRLNANLQQYVNISAYNGPTAVGTLLPTIGGAGWGTLDADTMGWTFEVTFKAVTRIIDGARIFEFSAPSATSGAANTNGIYLGFDGVRLVFSATDAQGSTATLTVLSTVQLSQWYHIVVEVQAVTSTSWRFVAYVDGLVVGAQTSGVMPAAVTRTDALIGRGASSSAPYFDGWVDSLRVYDYVLDADEVQRLAHYVHNVSVVAQAPLYHTDPESSYTFDRPMSQAELADSLVSWTRVLDSRSGIATFDGVSQFVNLQTLPDRNSVPMTEVFGNSSFSFEVRARWSAFNNNSALLDMAQRTTFADRVTISNVGTTNSLRFAVSYNVNDPVVITVPNALQLNTWHHIVMNIESNPLLSLTDPKSCMMQAFLNGKLVGTAYTMTPRLVLRPLSYLGRSVIASDSNFTGAIDAFYPYDYPLDAEQVRAHYTLTRVPEFELTFANDPRNIPGLVTTPSSTTYSWVNTDSSDNGADQAAHQGLLVLDAARGHYVDLNAPAGVTSVGTVLPMLSDFTTMLNDSWFPRNSNTSRLGMSLEMNFKLNAVTQNGHLFSCGVGVTSDSVALGWTGLSSGALQFTVYNTVVGKTKSITVLNSVDVGRWYHVTVVLRVQSINTYTSTYEVYINGVLSASINDGVYPYATARPACYLGRSTWSAASSPALVSASIDVLRVYDYALLASELPPLYQAAGAGSDGSAASSSSSLSGGAIAGIVIGAIVGVVIVAVLLVASLRRLKSTDSSGKSSRAADKHVDHDESEASEASEVELHETA